MKVVIFAHTPPPHHGQSFMVEQFLKGLSDPAHGIQAFHVNAQFAQNIHDIGAFRFGKVLRVFKYIGQALWYRVRHGARNLYYIPAPPLKNAVVRDWAILLLCRPFFSRLILHWHASGLADWLQTKPRWMQKLTHLALDNADLSIVLTSHNQSEIQPFRSKKTVVIPNGIPDPCPNFIARNPPGPTVRVLFMGLCLQEKGFLDAIEGVFRANAKKGGRQFHLTIAGKFFDPTQEKCFQELVAQSEQKGVVEHIGFVDGAAKAKLLKDSDIFCFPTYYFAENLPVVLLEALAFGLPIVATRWRSIPEILPPNSPGLVDVQSPDQIATALIELAGSKNSQSQRDHFLQNYTIERHITAMAAAFKSLD